MKHRLKQIGSAIRTERTRLNLSQRELGERADMHMRTVSEIERGNINMSVTSFLSIANGLGVPAPELLQEAMEIESIEEIVNGKAVVGIFFTASWCGPCKAIKPVVRAIFEDSGVEFVEINVEQLPEVAQEQRITSLPTLDVYSSGSVVERMVAPMPSKVRQVLDGLKRETVSPVGT